MNRLSIKKAFPNRRVMIVGLGGLAALTTWLLVHANSNPSVEQKAAAKPALTVTTVSPKQVDWPVKLLAKGSIFPWQEASIGAEASGLRLIEIKADIGDRVRRGQVLARLDADTVAAELAQTRANLAEARAMAAEAHANADRVRQLESGGALSAQQINQYLTAEQTAMARVDSLQARVKIDEKRLTQTRIVAPDDGTLSARSTTLGAVVQPGQELFRMIRRDRLEWRAELPADEIARVKPGMHATLSSAMNRVAGKVRVVSPSIDMQTRNGLIYVDLVNPGNARAGTFLQGEIELQNETTLVLPQSTLLFQAGLHYVFRIDAHNRLIQTRVDIGERAGDLVAIASGIDKKARVVASGVGFLADGDLVRIEPEAHAR